MIAKEILIKLYVDEQFSMKDISKKLKCSVHKVVYWMDQYSVPRRSISDAIYIKHNPEGDPFRIKPIKNIKDAELLGLGVGLYWGEGTKASKHTVRLGNSDPELIISFMNFLIRLFEVKKEDLRFGLQIFSDIDTNTALTYWIQKLDVKHSQFYKVHVTISGAIGTYRKKSKYGVVTVYYHNKKLRDILVGLLPR